MEIFIPESELRFEFMRSSGPGGQNVNKVETKVRVFWDFEGSEVLGEDEKVLVREKLAGRINKEGELYVAEDGSRSRERNREVAVERMQELVEEALEKEEERIEKMPRRVKRKVKAEKKDMKMRQSEKKKLRGDVKDW